MLAKDDMLTRYRRLSLLIEFIILLIPYTLPPKASLTVARQYSLAAIGLFPAVWITPLMTPYFNCRSLIRFFTDEASAISRQWRSTSQPLDFILSIILSLFNTYGELPSLLYILFLPTKTSLTLFSKEIRFAIDNPIPPKPPVIKITSFSWIMPSASTSRTLLNSSTHNALNLNARSLSVLAYCCFESILHNKYSSLNSSPTSTIKLVTLGNSCLIFLIAPTIAPLHGLILSVPVIWANPLVSTINEFTDIRDKMCCLIINKE